MPAVQFSIQARKLMSLSGAASKLEECHVPAAEFLNIHKAALLP